MKTTPELLKQRRKERRANSRLRAMSALARMVGTLGLADPFAGEDIPDNYMPSIRLSDTASLAALMRLRRRLKPLFIQAQDELERRYLGESERREKMYRKAVKDAVKEHGADANAFLKSHRYTLAGTWEEKK